MRVIADKYYGDAAERYDEARERSQRWTNEQVAVLDFVSQGPVIDVPVGTGRYVPIYRRNNLAFTGVDVSGDMLSVARRKHGAGNLHQGSILDLPFADGSFKTAICTRLLDWLCPEDMERAIAELRRVAEIIVCTIRFGAEGISVNWTHDMSRFYAQIDGLFIEARRVTEITRHGTEEIFKLRPPCWDDVAAQFRWHNGKPQDEMRRIAGVSVDLRSATISSEYWTHEVIGEVFDAIGGLHPVYAEEPAPRFEGGPATVLDLGDRKRILDGHRRFNRWRSIPGRHPILVLRP